jgi:hypothetical protein
MTWEGALTYCEGLTLANQRDWRLPNIKELGSIVDRSQFSPSIDTTVFPGTQSSGYWSSTTFVRYAASNAWSVNFYRGYMDPNLKSDSNYVRCVRGR